MLNRGLINREPLNRRLLKADYVMIRLDLNETLTGWTRIGADYHVRQRLSEQLAGNIILTKGQRSSAVLIERLNGSSRGLAAAKTTVALVETLTGRLKVGADIRIPEIAMLETLGGRAHTWANIYYASSFTESLQGAARSAANVFSSQRISEALTGFASIRDIEETICFINGTIPPGGVLIIDSDNFTVSLDGENVIHWHDGAWVSVSRNTLNITLSSMGAPDRDMEVFFVAKYL